MVPMLSPVAEEPGRTAALLPAANTTFPTLPVPARITGLLVAANVTIPLLASEPVTTSPPLLMVVPPVYVFAPLSTT